MAAKTLKILFLVVLMTATILQWNLNGFRPQYEYLQLLITEHQPDIITLQETNFNNNFIPYLRNYSIYYKNRENVNHSRGGVATYVKNNINHSKLALNTVLEATAVSVCLPPFVCICNVYLPNRINFDFNSLKDLIDQLPKPFILLGDFNSHNSLWGCSRTDQRGKIIEKILNNLDLVLLNSTDPTHYDLAYGTFSSIDLTICTPDISFLLNWSVVSTLHGSDHFPIIINSQQSSSSSIQTTKWNLNKANWSTFQDKVNFYLKDLPTPQDFKHKHVNQLIDGFTSLIIKSADQSVPKTKIVHSKRMVPWWNDACKEAIRNKNKSFYLYKRHPSVENKIKFQKYRAIARKIIKQSKVNSWKTFVSSLTIQTPQKVMWDKIKRINGKYRPFEIKTLKDPIDGSYLTHRQHIADCLANTFSKICSDTYRNEDSKICSGDEFESLDLETIYADSNQVINSELQLKELLRELDKCSSSSPGPDDIPYDFIKHLSLEALEYLLEIFNYIWNFKVFPDQWREAIVIPILKTGKDNSLPENYRPITLTCTLCKLMEKIVNTRLRWILEYQNFFSPFQSGFRKFHSTTDTLITIESEIREAYVNKHHLVTVSLDIEKAYDTVDKDYIVNVLFNNQIKGNMLSFIYNFLQRRQIQVKANGHLSEKVPTKNGVPQGSVISVTLFLTAINDIMSNIKLPVKGCLFADDLTIFCAGKSINTAQKLLQNTLDNIHKWTKTTALKLSKTKSKCIVFSKSKHINHSPILYIDGYKIEVVKTLRILGLLFDSKLTWKPHIFSIKNECLRRLNTMKMLAAKNWGADYYVLINTYKSVIRSKLDYGAIVYNSASLSTLKILDTIQSTSLRIALGAFHTSPITSLQIETDEPPLSVRRKQLSINYALKIAALTQSRIKSYVFSNRHKDKFPETQSHALPFHLRIAKYLAEHNIDLPPVLIKNTVPVIPPWTINVPTINLGMNQTSKPTTYQTTYQQQFKELCKTFSKYIPIYTDGSKHEDNCGCAIVYSDHTMLYRLPHLFTVFSCELFAIKQAMIYIHQNNDHDFFIIFSDCKSAIIALQQIPSSVPLVEEIQILYNDIKNSGKDIIISWLPSHCGIAGNECADRAAKEATEQPLSDPTIQTPHNDIINYISRKSYNRWKTDWLSASSSNLHEIRNNCPSKYPLKHLNRKDQILISRLRIGHSKITHSYILNKDQPPICEVCNKRLSVKHIIVECNKYDKWRQKCKIPNDIQKTLNTPSLCNHVLNFFKQSNLYNLI